MDYQDESEIAPEYWIPRALVSLIFIIMNGWILSKELWTRKTSPSIHFVTNSLRIFSILCIVFGFCGSIMVSVIYTPGFCHFGPSGSMICLDLQYLFMGWYQLTRLHYCFSREQIRSENGYVLFGYNADSYADNLVF